MEIQPRLFNMHDFLSGRLFRIPDYQRAYSWETKQRQDLLDDIVRVKASDEDHFMATIVCLERKGEKKELGANQYSVMEIVDGQQRLTTLILLLKAIHKALSSGTKAEKKLKDELSDLLVKDDNHTLLLLQTNHDTSGIFADYLREGLVPKSETRISADQNIADAIEECEEFVSKWKSDGMHLVELTSIIRYRLSAVFHIVEDEGLVYRVFEVLNSRGLEVATLDKLKSQLMGVVFEEKEAPNNNDAIRELHGIWTDIYRTIGKQTFGTETLRFAGTLKLPTGKPHKRPLGEEMALAALIALAGSKRSSVVKCAKWLQTVVNAEAQLLSYHRWRAVTRIIQARLVAIAIMMNDFEKADKGKLLNQWEHVTFRIYGFGGRDKRTKVGDYTSLAWDIVNEKLKVDEIIEALQNIGSDFPIDELIDEFDASDCYNGWGEQLRYLLYRYEEHLARQAGEKLNDSQWNKIWLRDPSKSVEHIKPQSSGVAYVHHLGNLMMLPPGVNSKLRDKDPKDKAKSYANAGLLSSVEVSNTIKGNSGWSRQLAEERANRILAWAKVEWKS